jgi:putative exporter of polyketide antibiotics
MVTALLLPTIALFALGVVVARLVERAVPESSLGLAVQAIGSGLVMTALSAALFAVLYARGGTPLGAALDTDPAGGVAHFLGLGARAALIWAPAVLLVVVTAPRRWRHARW